MNGVDVSCHSYGSLNIGIDLESISRFEEGGNPLVSSDAGRVFTREEHERCQAVARPAACYAVHWCAKEAGIKALWPWIHLDPRRLCLHRDESDRFSLLIDGISPSKLGLTLSASVSCSSTTAVAVVVASPIPGD